MPYPFCEMRDHLRPHEGTSERALLEQLARLALADERRQRRHERRNRRRQSGSMRIAALRLACAICLVLVVLGALASKAAAHGPGWVSVAVTPHATSTLANPAPTANSSDSFDWADAGVGAAFGALLVPLLAGGVLLLYRAWVSAQLPARSRPR